jgi:aspartate ammonia-lyase
VVNQVAFQVIGNDVTISLASEGGQLQLNVFEPIIAFNLYQSISMMCNAFETLASKCVDGITANEEHCHDLVLNSIGLVTALNPYIGYQNSTMVAKEALETNRSVYDIVLEKELLTQAQLDEYLKPENMIHPHWNEECTL